LLLLENVEAVIETKSVYAACVCLWKSAISLNTSPTALTIFLQGSVSITNATVLIPHLPKGRTVGNWRNKVLAPKSGG